MKRLIIVLITCLICTLSVSCSGGELQALKEQNASLKKQVSELEGKELRPVSWYKSEEFSEALKLFDEFIETDSAQLGIAKTDTLQFTRLDKLSDRYFLAAYMIAPIQTLTNNFYVLIDMDKGECAQINLETVDYISEITYDENSISFYCDGQNVMNGFRDFPHVRKYDIASKKFTVEYPYKSLQSSESEIRMGNWMNQAGLGAVIENNKTISFNFAETEGSILAGGMFCPNITAGLKLDGTEQDRTLYIDFETLVLSKEAEKQIMSLKDLSYISDVSIRNYKDVHEISHVVLYLKFKDVKEYSCGFKEDSSNGFMNFQLMLR